jgi:hypothetical protein
MKKLSLLLTMALTVPAVAGPLHLDLEMTSGEYRSLLKIQERSSEKSIKNDDPAITRAIKLGERLSKWIAKVNTGRTEATAIRLTSATTRRGIPIDKPNKYSPSIIKKDTDSVMSELPASIKLVLESNSELPGTIPLDDETFITFARRLDRNYQSAARYKSVDQYRYHYIQAANKDVRGYHYLMTNKIEEKDLRDVSLIPVSKITPIKEALSLICLNSLSNISKCNSEVASAFASNRVSQMYKKYFQHSKRVWDSFFKIPVNARRSDISWSGNSATVPFNTPEIPKFIPYLQDNIEDEFRWNGWVLKMSFGYYPNGPLLKFEPGVVPHVNGLGGNEIVMDSNQPIEEYESKWTIRHEFGHVLGLPDCYHEFYDTNADAYVNYQLDITDLMCSRAGNMNGRIYKELKEAYAK